jgi:ferredoxin
MSVEITFQPAGLKGLVAEGAYLIEVARRMGVRLPTDCRERGECTSCAVLITAGQSLLSPPTNAEQKMLSSDRLVNNHRLACQARIENSGELQVQLISRSDETGQQNANPAGSNQKTATAVEENAMRMIKQFDAFVDKSLSAGEDLMDRFAARIRLARERELERKRPPEHSGRKNT